MKLEMLFTLYLFLTIQHHFPIVLRLEMTPYQKKGEPHDKKH